MSLIYRGPINPSYATVNVFIARVWRLLTPASPHLVILQSGTGHTLLRLHLVLWKMRGDQRQQVVGGAAGHGWLLAGSVPVRGDGREGRGLLQGRWGGKHALEVCYCWKEGRERG